MKTELERKALVKTWADHAVGGIKENTLDFEEKADSIISQIVLKEHVIQYAHEQDIDLGGGDENTDHRLFAMKLMIMHLDRFEVPRTRAVEVIAALGIHDGAEALVMAGILAKLFADNQSTRVECLKAKPLEVLLSRPNFDCIERGTISQAYLRGLYTSSLIYDSGVKVSLLDIAKASDFRKD